MGEPGACAEGERWANCCDQDCQSGCVDDFFCVPETILCFH